MLVRRLILVFAAALAVSAAGCGGGGSSTIPGSVASASHSGVPAARRKSKQGIRGIAPIGACPEQAIFLRLPGEIRGYPLAATGYNGPCADIIGPQTLLTGNGNGYGAIAVSVHGYLHALAFQSNAYGGLLVFAPDAMDDAAPSRSVLVDQDHVALAVDSQVNDYVVASQNYTGDNCWYVVPATALTSSTSSCDSNVSAIYALAVTPQDELVVLGSDATTSATRIDVFASPAAATPTLVRSIAGAATGLPIANNNYFSYGYSLAADPVVGSIYVFSADSSALTAPKVSIFDAAATGNVAPTRTLSGALTQLPAGAFAINVLAVDTASNLYVNSTGLLASDVVVSVFGPSAAGNVAPTRTMIDDTLLNPSSGGIAVRS